MGIVTLTTDFGTRDPYVAAVKGAILNQDATVRFVDISHDIEPFNIVAGSYALKNCWKAFPVGTIHILSVDSLSAGSKQFVVFKHAGHYFLGPNNGIFSLIFQDPLEEIFLIDYSSFQEFPLATTYAKAVAHILSDSAFAGIGSELDRLAQKLALQPVIYDDQIRGSVIHIDRYENVITNITRDLFDRVRAARDFELLYQREDPILKLSETYADEVVGDVLCLFNAANHLEIAINMGKAASLLGLAVDKTVQINFKGI